MVNHWKCRKCGGMNVERKSAKRFEAEATLYEDEQGKFNEEDIGFGTKEEEGGSFLHCKDCHNMEDNGFVLMPDTD